MTGQHKVSASRAAIQRALRVTTETLANELARPTGRTPSWTDFEWRIARASAAMHGVSALAVSLPWYGPQAWHDFLAEQRLHTAHRQQRIANLLRTIDARAQQESLGLVALKGAALHDLGLYRHGDRPMADLDLLVAPADAQRASRLVESLGFELTHDYWRHRSFAPPDSSTHAELGEHADNYIKIELHERLSERLPVCSVDIAELVLPRAPAPGLNPYPSITALLAHLLLHTAGSIVSRSLRLLQLHDLALLSKRMTAADWSRLLALSRANPSDRWWWALPPLLLTARYYPGVIDEPVLAEFASCCPRHLRKIMQYRRLCDVSLSYLGMEAFPGIEWARSHGERARYVRLRIRPSAEMLATRHSQALTEPGLAANPWTHLEQGTRILRWIICRPARPATMYAVNAALAT